MKLTRSILAALACAVLILSACGPAKGTSVPTPVSTFTPTMVTKSGDCPSIPDAPIPVNPNTGDVIDDLTPLLWWGYEDANCYPDSYVVYLHTGPLFQDELGGPTNVATWQVASDLQPSTEYDWGVAGVSDGVTGLVGGSHFFTGPTCGGNGLTEPILLSPMNNWVVHDLSSLTLSWDNLSECLPDYYEVELTSNLDFNNSSLNGSTNDPVTHWNPGVNLTDCTRYYWRVRPISNAEKGPYSVVYNFKVEISGGCPLESNGSIQGTVFEDQCAGWAGDPNDLPLGCTINGDELSTNHTYDPGEPGIPGAIVALMDGPCPSATIMREVPTGPDGVYAFYMVNPGTYCVGVDAAYQLNAPTFLPGSWTSPEGINGYNATRTVTVTAGQATLGTDFGWWYKFGLPWGSSDTAAVFGLVWNDLCAVDPGDPIPDPLPSNCVYDQYGVHADGIHDQSEYGIPGVIVDIGVGDCPSAGLTQAVTDTNGYYHFDKLAPGKYCLRIDPAHGSPNEAILLPDEGEWTVIPSGHEGMTFRAITLVADHTLAGQDFAWDYFNNEVITPTPVLPSFTLTVNAYCRKGPGSGFEPSTNGIAGKSYPIEAVSADEGWYRLMVDSLHCWVGAATGTVNGSLLGVPRLFIATPTPVPPLNYCAQFKTIGDCRLHVTDGCAWNGTSCVGK